MRRERDPMNPYRKCDRAYCLACDHDMPRPVRQCRRCGSRRVLRYYTGDGAPISASCAPVTEVNA